VTTLPNSAVGVNGAWMASDLNDPRNVGSPGLTSVAVNPEPASLGLIGAALVAATRRRRRRV
jgi:hypothetical protein